MAGINLDYLAGKSSNRVGVILLAIGLAGLASLFWYYQGLGKQISLKEERVASLLEQQRKLSAPQEDESRDAEQVALETKQVNSAILALSLPWKDFFAAFESTQNKDVAVLEIEPDPQKGRVRISAEARKLESMLDYISSLQKLPMFREVRIMNHQYQEQDPQKPIRFMLQAEWEKQS